MSMVNWIWDISQDGRIRELEEKSEAYDALLKRVENLEDWIRYLNDKLEKQNEDDTRTTD
jgi:hypothetical protein